MSEKTTDGKKLSVSGRKTLQLKKAGGDNGGQPRQDSSGGRGPVVVERKKRKLVKPGEKAPAPAAKSASTAANPAAPAKKKPAAKLTAKGRTGSQGNAKPKKDEGLTDGERAARVAALKGAVKMEEQRRREEAERKEREAAAAQRAAEEVKRKAAQAEQKKAEEEAAQKAKEAKETTAAAEPVKEAPASTSAQKTSAARPAKKPVAAEGDAPVVRSPEKGGRNAEVKPKLSKPAKGAKKTADTAGAGKPGRGGDQRRRSGKLTVQAAFNRGDDEGGRQRSLAAMKRAREKEKRKMASQGQEHKKIVRDVVVPETITVQELANRMAERGTEVIKALMKMGMMVTINQDIDQDTAELIVEEFGHNIKRVSESDADIQLPEDDDKDEDLLSRAPVVTVMGHVDHGKTSLLDALRASDVAAGEAGGITQHIGAYQVTMESGQKITFLDTPGHAAFTAMRSRGAQATDLVVLVVAADDGIMPQTIEAIHHAKAADVPIIVAINKIDKDGADPSRVRQDLLQHEVFVENMGGDVLDVEVSAKKGLNLDKLEEAILLQAELLDLKANPDRMADGIVIESQLDKGRGPVATLLVQRGTLRVGDVVVAGNEWGKVRALQDERGRHQKEAGPSVAVEIQGLNGTPSAGDLFSVVENESRAREVANFRQGQVKKAKVGGQKATLENMFTRLKDKEVAAFPVLVKSDVQGSAEAITTALDKMSTDEVKANILHSGVGGITESDVILAKASEAPILAFNVRPNRQAKELSAREGVEIRYYSVIYDLIDDVKDAMSGLLSPEMREHILGAAEILQVFAAGKTGKAAGCLVTDGYIKAGTKARLLRDDVVVYEGDLASLRRFKDDVSEVQSGMECGMGFKNYDDIRVGDYIECFEVEEVARSL